MVAGIGFLENRTLRIHLVDTFPSPGQTWEDHVTDRFEADICKGVVNSNGDVTFAMRKEDLERGCYKFIIRNLVHPIQIIKRMKWYFDQGLEPSKIEWHKDCSAWYKDFVNKYLSDTATNVSVKLFRNNGIFDDVVSDLTRDRIMPFLTSPPRVSTSWDRLLLLGKLHEELMHRVNQFRGRTPGLMTLRNVGESFTDQKAIAYANFLKRSLSRLIQADEDRS